MNNTTPSIDCPLQDIGCTYEKTGCYSCALLIAYERGRLDGGARAYQQSRADALYDLWHLVISKYDEILSLEDLAKDLEQIKEKKYEGL